MRSTRRMVAAAVAVLPVALTAGPASRAQSSASPAECRAGGPAVEFDGTLTPADRETYRELLVSVADGTTRIEVGYSWTSNGPETEVEKTVVDLGLWDEDGTHSPAGFRGWSGSRMGKVAEGQPPIFVQPDKAERGYVPGAINPGTWSVELGFGAVHPAGGAWHVTVTCLAPTTGPEWVPDPVDPAHVARNEPGWYRGDFHLHAFHSNARGPDPEAMVEFAQAAKLDIVPVTEYVTNTQWGDLGAAQQAHPDVLIFPGREVITYFGHAIVLGETPSTIEYRQGFEGVNLREIQTDATNDGAVFSVAHPTIFPGEALQSFCRGCEFRLRNEVDWDLVDTMEVVTGPVVVDLTTFERPEPGKSGIANPFVPTAVDLWESLLQQGHRITAVSGSDDKLGPGYGQTATMVRADKLSRAAVVDALRAGHAYVQTKGADFSPTFEIDAHTPDGTHAMFGDTLVGTNATIDVSVQGATGQNVVVSRNGTEVQRIPITSDSFTTSIAADRDPAEGPLGTFWRVDLADDLSFTAIGNPVFLADRQPPPKQRGAVPTVAPAIPNFPAAPAAGSSATAPPSKDDDGAPVGLIVGGVLVVVLVALGAVSATRRRQHR